MFDRLTIKTLLQTTSIALALVAVLPLGSRAWDAWNMRQASDEILKAAGAANDAFEVMINIRSDRSSTPRIWASAEAPAADASAYLKDLQGNEMRAFQSLAQRLEDTGFENKTNLVPRVRQSLETITRLQSEFWDGLARPLASRRAALGEEYLKEGLSLQALLEDVSKRLAAAIQHKDAIVDQMMAVKQLAWIARDNAGDASLLMSKGLAVGKLPASSYRDFDKSLGAAGAAWRGIEDVLAGVSIPASLTDALANAKQIYFSPEYAARREQVLAALVSGGDAGMNANQWSMFTVPKMGAMLGVAQSALAAASSRGETMRAEATRTLIIDILLLLLVSGSALVAVLAINKRVIRPLGLIRDAMTGLANGQSDTEISFKTHDDEIGALAGTLQVFQTHAAAKAKLEADELGSRAREMARQQTIEAGIHRFESAVQAVLGNLTGAASRMNGACGTMEAVSSRAATGVRGIAEAAAEASGSVTGIAAAAEQLSGSINEISRHVAQATGITGRAVEETRRTDATVRGLADSASKIGEVVKLINDIAGRTNLLALNATIEAARAGEAGKGFAVVASEVKSLANQTAKATEDIARQIAEVQSVTHDTVQAIQRIATTINDVDEVATSIAAGVEQQGNATQEIARNVQQAAGRTHEMVDTVERVTHDSRAADDAAGDVKSAAGEVARETEALRQRVDVFLEEIRAA